MRLKTYIKIKYNIIIIRVQQVTRHQVPTQSSTIAEPHENV